jgi:hypothetical protein
MKDRIRTWSRRLFYDPEPVLKALRSLEVSLQDQPIPELVRRLRTNKLKGEREARDAAIFAHGMAAVCGTKILVSPGEAEDCDFITKARVGDEELYSCVQLKELAPDDLSPDGTLEPLVKKVATLAEVRRRARDTSQSPSHDSATAACYDQSPIWRTLVLLGSRTHFK